MLVDFRVENHRSLRDEQALTMEAGRVGDDDDPRPRRVAGVDTPLLPVAVLYGANASGKSNVLAALAFMRAAVVDSHGRWSPDSGVPLDPFAWGPKRKEPSTFIVTLVLDGIRFEYGFSANKTEFLEEWLFAWPNGRKQVWFEREQQSFKFGDEFGNDSVKLAKIIKDVTRSNSLFISTGSQNRIVGLTPVYSWFSSLQSLHLPTRGYGFGDRFDEMQLARALLKERQLRLFEVEEASLLNRFRDFLRYADIGVVDIRAERSEEDLPFGPRTRTWFYLKHHPEFDDAWLPLREESKGTQTLFREALPILLAIEEGTTLIVDELEASLHPSLAQKIVGLFNDPTSNPKNAQLIFTTHDTNLIGTTLGEPVLRRDQVWLVEKDSDGASVLYPLTDFKPRKSENLERGYLQGRYGAVPFLGGFAVGGE